MATRFSINYFVSYSLDPRWYQNGIDDITEEVLDVENDLDFDPNQEVNARTLQVEENDVSDT